MHNIPSYINSDITQWGLARIKKMWNTKVKVWRGCELYVTLPAGWGICADFQLALLKSANRAGNTNTAGSLQKK